MFSAPTASLWNKTKSPIYQMILSQRWPEVILHEASMWPSNINWHIHYLDLVAFLNDSAFPN